MKILITGIATGILSYSEINKEINFLKNSGSQKRLASRKTALSGWNDRPSPGNDHTYTLYPRRTCSSPANILCPGLYIYTYTHLFCGDHDFSCDDVFPMGRVMDIDGQYFVQRMKVMLWNKVLSLQFVYLLMLLKSATLYEDMKNLDIRKENGMIHWLLCKVKFIE